MNRELKFRAWHKAEKKLCEVQTLTNEGAFLIGVNKGKDEVFDKIKVFAPDDGRFCKFDEIEIMQFTGLFDKNGKEIYESHICIIPYLRGEKTRGVIEFKNGSFVFSSKEDPTKQVVGWSMINPKETEVIGNIFEHKKLLKKIVPIHIMTF